MKKLLFMSWRRSAIKEVNDWALNVNKKMTHNYLCPVSNFSCWSISINVPNNHVNWSELYWLPPCSPIQKLPTSAWIQALYRKMDALGRSISRKKNIDFTKFLVLQGRSIFKNPWNFEKKSAKNNWDFNFQWFFK